MNLKKFGRSNIIGVAISNKEINKTKIDCGDNGLDVNTLDSWSSDPDSAYISITPDDTQLEDLFEELAKNISNPGATNIVITDIVNPCLKITEIVGSSKGIANI